MNKRARASARHQLFWYLKSLAFTPYISGCIVNGAITKKERDILVGIIKGIKELQDNYFENSKALGMQPKRRCSVCSKVAEFKTNHFGDTKYFCREHIKELNGVVFIKINPNE